MAAKENVLTAEQKAEKIADELIKAIAEGTITKDILMNEFPDFSVDGEARFINSYCHYLRSLSYVLDKRLRV